jgi:hypothetical protein
VDALVACPPLLMLSPDSSLSSKDPVATLLSINGRNSVLPMSTNHTLFFGIKNLDLSSSDVVASMSVTHGISMSIDSMVSVSTDHGVVVAGLVTRVILSCQRCWCWSLNSSGVIASPYNVSSPDDGSTSSIIHVVSDVGNMLGFFRLGLEL